MKPPLEIASGENFLDKIRNYGNNDICWFFIHVGNPSNVVGINGVYISYNGGFVLCRGDVISVFMIERNTSSIIINTFNSKLEWTGWKRINSVAI